MPTKVKYTSHLWAKIKYLKSAVIPIFKLNLSRYESDLSNEALCSLVAQRNVELLKIKVGGLKKEMVLLDPGTHVFESTLICKTIFSRSANLTSSSFAAFWATRLQSTSFERSDSYLLGFSLEVGITALLKYFISSQRHDIYLILHGHRANQTALAFFRILERSWPLT